MGTLPRSNSKIKKRRGGVIHPNFRRVGPSTVSSTGPSGPRHGYRRWVGWAVGASALLHGLVALTMMQLDHSPVTTPPPVTITVVPKEAPPKPDPKKDPPPKPRPKDRKVASERKPKQPPAPTAKPVQGLSAEAISAEGTGIAAPIGNTLMTEDEGKRLKAEDVGALGNQDLSADARLIRSSFQTPSYTEAAIDAAIEGTYVVDVYVDETGNVTSAELTKKVGYGMDERLLAAANQARFEPRKNRFGKAEPGWTTISFRLELP